MQLTPVHQAYVDYVLALTTPACTAMTITTECDQCGTKAELTPIAKRDGNRLELCGPCLRGAK